MEYREICDQVETLFIDVRGISHISYVVRRGYQAAIHAKLSDIWIEINKMFNQCRDAGGKESEENYFVELVSDNSTYKEICIKPTSFTNNGFYFLLTKNTVYVTHGSMTDYERANNWDIKPDKFIFSFNLPFEVKKPQFRDITKPIGWDCLNIKVNCFEGIKNLNYILGFLGV